MIFARPGLGIGLATGPVVTSGLGIQEQVPAREKPTGFKPFKGGKRKTFYVDRVRHPVPKGVESQVPVARRAALPEAVDALHPLRQKHVLPGQDTVNLPSADRRSLPQPKNSGLPKPKRLPPADKR